MGKYVAHVEKVLIVATWLFIVTHLDTFVVLVAFCVNNNYRTSEVLLGHYAGFSIGLFGAVLAAVIAAGFLQKWTFLLGTIPLSMGVWGLVRRQPEIIVDESEAVPGPGSRIGIVTVAGVGLSGENLAVFIPFFADLSMAELALVVGMYLISAGVVFIVALIVGRRTVAAVIPVWIGRWLVPTVLLFVGVYVLVTGWILF